MVSTFIFPMRWLELKPLCHHRHGMEHAGVGSPAAGMGTRKKQYSTNIHTERCMQTLIYLPTVFCAWACHM